MPPTGRRPARPQAGSPTRTPARPPAKPSGKPRARTQDRPQGRAHGKTQAGAQDRSQTGAQDKTQDRTRDPRRPARSPARPQGAHRDTRSDRVERPAAPAGREGFIPVSREAAGRPDARHKTAGARPQQGKPHGPRGPRSAGKDRPRSGTAPAHARHDRPGKPTNGRTPADTLPPEPAPRPVPTEPLPVLYQDRHVVIVNKPAGLPVHAGPRTGLCVEDWFPQLSRRADGPWLVHRLDADTAGCLAIALRKQPLLAMQQAFANHTARKTYWAIVRNGPTEEKGRIDLPLVRENTPSGWHMRPDPAPKPANAAKNAATTLWRVLGRGKGLCWLELTLLSGRTHQARVHCAAMGWPIVGDALYGKADAHGLHLLAQGLSLPLDPTITVTAPPPPSMHAALRACGWEPDAP